MRILETEWFKFRNAAIPKDAPSTQLTEMRRAFFAGAWAFYTLVMTRLDPAQEPTHDDMMMMEMLDAEMREFNERVKKGWA